MLKYKSLEWINLLISDTQREYMEVEGQSEIKMFCKDYVQRAEVGSYYFSSKVIKHSFTH